MTSRGGTPAEGLEVPFSWFGHLIDPEVAMSVGLSLIVSIAATLITAAFGIPLAYGLSTIPGSGRSRILSHVRGIIDFLLLLPLTLPPTVVGYLLLIAFGKEGPAGRFLAWAFDTTVIFSLAGAIIASAVVSFPLLVRVATSAFEAIDRGHAESARTLGYGRCEILMRVSVPLAARGLLAALALAFCRSLGEFGATLMLAGNIPGRTATMPLALYSFVSSGEWEKANALVFVLMCLSAVFLMAARLVEARL